MDPPFGMNGYAYFNAVRLFSKCIFLLKSNFFLYSSPPHFLLSIRSSHLFFTKSRTRCGDFNVEYFPEKKILMLLCQDIHIYIFHTLCLSLNSAWLPGATFIASKPTWTSQVLWSSKIIILLLSSLAFRYLIIRTTGS